MYILILNCSTRSLSQIEKWYPFLEKPASYYSNQNA